MHEPDQVIAILRRAFNSGAMRRLPKKRSEAEVVMALSVVGLKVDTFYDETEINTHLSAWLEPITSVADYVTLRRELVDLGFLRRASDGAIYRTVSERVDELLTPAAQQIDPKAIFAQVESARIERKIERQKEFGNG